MEILDLPVYLKKNNNRIDNVKMVCVLDKQIKMPEYLSKIDKSGTNIASLVDVIGVDIAGKKYFSAGKVLVVLGPRTFEPTKYGKRILLLNGNMISRSVGDNYVELTLIYSVGNRDSLYATRTLYREVSDIRPVYPEFMKAVDEIAIGNWNLDAFWSAKGLSSGYHFAGQDVDFQEEDESKKFKFKSEQDYRKSQMVVNKSENNTEVKTNNIQHIDTNSKKVELECRSAFVSKPKNFNLFEKIQDNLQKKVDNKLKILQRLSSNSVSIDAKLDYLYRQIKNHWRNAPSSKSITGRALLKTILEHLYPNYKNKYEAGVPLIDFALDRDILEVWYTGLVPTQYSKNMLFNDVSILKEGLYIAVIDYLFSLRSKLINAYNYSADLEIDMISVLEQNPYYLALIDNRLSVEDLDKLALFYRVDLKDAEVMKFRNAAYLHNFMTDISNDFIKENTIVLKQDIINSVYNGFRISSKSYSYINTLGIIVSDKILENLKYYIKSDLSSSDLSLPKKGWREKRVRGVSKYILNFEENAKSEDVVKDYVDVGLGSEVVLDNRIYLIDYVYLSKELYIYNRLYELQDKGDKPVLNPNDIDRCIRGFETLKSLEWNIPQFKLEDRQADAVRWLYNPILCVTGPAGSGKTTTAEAILFGLQALLGIDEDSIMFCAPTGKAANRLKEIVKKPTRTINSLFGIGGESFTIMKESNVKKKSEIKVLIVDESSMINLELMYNMISKIADGTRIIFLGDKEQLPPIGSGKPFADMLSILPCIVLNVLKRASDKSGITRNAQSLIYESDQLSPPELQNYDDFRILETPKEKIVELVTGIVNYHLGRLGEKRVGNTNAAKRVLQSLDVDLNPDDIQVVTPVNKYEWGTKHLNSVLQEIINPKNTSQYSLRYLSEIKKDIDSYGNSITKEVYSEYRLNERVIHLENAPREVRYSKCGRHVYQQLHLSTGVMNGDVGKIVDIVKGSELKFVLDDGSDDQEAQDMFSNSDDVIYIAVAYQDVDEFGSPSEYIIFYKTDIIHTPENDSLLVNQKIYTVDGTSLRKLDLAYVLTVHKLQGSQAKLIIFVVYPVGYSDFISCNLLYTGITRAVEGIYLVGNVSIWNNVISKGRKIQQNKLRTTIIDKIYELEN